MSRWLFLSPHLDDAVLSCGGLIAKLAGDQEVTVATVFSSAPWWGPYSQLAGWLHGVSGARNAAWLALTRRREDAIACGRLGADYLHLKWCDAVYRRSCSGDFLYPHRIQTDPAPEDQGLAAALAREINRRAADADYLIAPLGIGRHVDHLIVREAAERCGRSLLYYPDIPYLWEHSVDLLVRAGGLRSVEYCVDGEFVALWVAAVSDYRSQLKMLSEVAAPICGRIREYSAGRLALYASAFEGGLELP